MNAIMNYIRDDSNVKLTSSEQCESTPSNEFTRSTVEGFGNRVSITDTDDNGLELFCYNSCSEADSSTLHQCRGVVFHGQNIVMKAFPFTVEYPHSNYDDIDEDLSEVLGQTRVFDAHEGALIRVFYFNGKWYVSTHRKLDAYRSKWASRQTFGELFEQAIVHACENNPIFSELFPGGDEPFMDKFFSILSPLNQYMFLVRNNDTTRIVCEGAPFPLVYHVGTFTENGSLDLDVDIGLPFPREHSFNTTKEMCDYVDTISPYKLQGVILFAPNNVQYKIVNTSYQDLFSLRGNQPSVKFRYLQIRQNPQLNEQLRLLYPDQVHIFEKYEKSLKDITNNIYSAYVRRFIRKQHTTVSPNMNNIMKEAHGWHISNRSTNKVSLQKVYEILMTRTPTTLNHMIRAHDDYNKKLSNLNENECICCKCNSVNIGNSNCSNCAKSL